MSGINANVAAMISAGMYEQRVAKDEVGGRTGCCSDRYPYSNVGRNCGTLSIYLSLCHGKRNTS